jgi:hypothetical protein
MNLMIDLTDADDKSLRASVLVTNATLPIDAFTVARALCSRDIGFSCPIVVTYGGWSEEWDWTGHRIDIVPELIT